MNVRVERERESERETQLLVPFTIPWVIYHNWLRALGRPKTAESRTPHTGLSAKRHSFKNNYFADM